MCPGDPKETWPKTVQGPASASAAPSGVELKIISIVEGRSKAWSRPKLGCGEIGEILVRSKYISPLYYNEAESTRKNKIIDGDGETWHRYGDTGYIDEQGRLWVCGRVGHRVKTARGPLFPLICESIFETHPWVQRCGLVGVPGRKGERAVACIELKPGCCPGERARLREELLALAAGHEVTSGIKQLLFKSSLPVDPRHNSKIERPALARWAARQLRKKQR